MTVMTVEQWDARPWVGMPVTAELAHWDEVNALVPTIYGALAGAGGTPTGGPIFQYRRMTTADEPMDLTVAVPVSAPVDAGAGLESGQLPAGRYLVARPAGGPDILAAVHGEMWQWADEEGLDLAIEHREDGIHWEARTEQFLTDPRAEPDRRAWSVEVAYLLR